MKKIHYLFRIFFKTFLKIIGEDFNFDGLYFIWKVLYLPYVIFLLPVLPLVVVIDALARDADILFVSPAGMSILSKYLQNTNVIPSQN